MLNQVQHDDKKENVVLNPVLRNLSIVSESQYFKQEKPEKRDKREKPDKPKTKTFDLVNHHQ